MKWHECKNLILEDYNRKKVIKIKKGSALKYFVDLVFNDSFKVSFWFRIISFLRLKKKYLFFLYYPLWFYYAHITRLTGIQLPIGTSVGGGICFCHFGTVVIASSVIIGKNVSIHPDVTLGRSFAGSKKGIPTIGNNVVIFAGAKIVGNVKIGNNAVIGANAVVVDDVPENSVAAGIPAKIISNNAAKCFDEHWGKTFEHEYV